MSERQHDKQQASDSLVRLLLEHSRYMETYSEPFVGSTLAIARVLEGGAKRIEQLERELAERNEQVGHWMREARANRSTPSATLPPVLLDACREWQKHADHKDGLDNVESALYGAIVIALKQAPAPSTEPKETIPRLCVFPQSSHHMDAQIIGTKGGLQMLATTLLTPAEVGTAETETLFAGDGEGFNVIATRIGPQEELDTYYSDYAEPPRSLVAPAPETLPKEISEREKIVNVETDELLADFYRYLCNGQPTIQDKERLRRLERLAVMRGALQAKPAEVATPGKGE